MNFRFLLASFLHTCLLGLASVTSTPGQTRYEAEAPAPQVTLTQANIGSSYGVSYAENLIQEGSAVAFRVSVPTTGMYTVKARYAAAREYNWTMSVYVNDVDVTQAQFATTGSWASWNTQAVTVALQAGTNTIKYKYDGDDSGWINLDYITVSPAWTPGFTAGSAAAGALPQQIGVNKFTGTATFDAPLHTISIPNFSLPLALHYSATGLQIDNSGGEIGANWSLQGGLSIQREVRDLPDDIKVETSATPERRYGWLRYPAGSASPASRIAAIPNATGAFSSNSCTSAEQLALTQLTAMGALQHFAGTTYSMYDTEPDVFSYAVPGYAGKFVFDGNGSGAVRLMPYAPLEITPLFAPQVANCSYSVPTGELTGFTIKTAEGVTYTFAVPTRLSVLTQTNAPYGGTKYLLRHFYNYNIHQYTSGPSGPTGPTTVDYTSSWSIARITTPAANTSLATQAPNRITFEYDCASYIPQPKSTSNLFLLGNSTAQPSPHYRLATRVMFSPKLAAIRTATVLVSLARELDEWDNFHVSSIAITAPLEQNALIKSYTFKYLNSGRFLSQVLLNRSTSSLPLFTFTYAKDAETGSLPGAVTDNNGRNRDYWGFANGNKATTGIPQLYIYPQLLNTASPRPAAPYRLYPVPAYASGGIVLPGSDRRPANRLSVALAGTLTEVTFATGGKVALEYEQNQFYDEVAQQSLPAGGLRIRTIKIQDPITRVETRRDYLYQQPGNNNSGISSGVLLHIPRFAFAVPLNNTFQWADVTVRSTEELSTDPFENRTVGYKTVTEILPGKGQVITSFAVPAGADDNTSPGNTDSGLPAWQRPVFGVARQTINGICPSVGPLQAVGELYPFAPAPNYDFCRGLITTVQYRAEPTSGTAPGALVRQEDYTYQFKLSPLGLGSVPGLRYEQLGEASTPLYAYAKYNLLTDFFYVSKQQVSSQFVAGGATSQSSVNYRYNNRGWLAAKIVQGSDNTIGRTRYKYLSDYALPASGVSGALLAMKNRVNEGITSDLVETISEIRPAGTTGRVAYVAATLQTFTTSTVLDDNNTPVTTPTYPYQIRRWQPAQPVATYDSVRVVNNALYVPAALHLASTVQAVNLNLTPLSIRTEAGRQIASKHLAYEGSVPVLQIANATAAEVVFSDFEILDKPYKFGLTANSVGYFPYPSATAVRTGQQGLILIGGGSLTTTLPASAAAQYRLVYWTKTATATSTTVTISLGQSGVFNRTLAHTGNGQWQRNELLLPVASLSPRTSYQLAITAASGVDIHVDDVLLLPAEASATSTTFSFAVLDKTSETDPRGRTTYYEYGPTGELALVRDHNQSIVHRYQRVLPNTTLLAGISFTSSGTMIEGESISFSATSSLKGPLQYKWDFGDGALTSYSTSTEASHAYLVTGTNQEYLAKLYVLSQGKEYVYSRKMYIGMRPLLLTTCTAGIVSFDDCNHSNGGQMDISCNPSAPNPSSSTTFQVMTNLSGSFSYQWEYFDSTSGVWTPWTGTGNNTPSITITTPSRLRFRCRVGNANQETISEELGIEHYKSDLNCP
jgi:hypothetical protein